MKAEFDTLALLRDERAKTHQSLEEAMANERRKREDERQELESWRQGIERAREKGELATRETIEWIKKVVDRLRAIDTRIDAVARDAERTHKTATWTAAQLIIQEAKATETILLIKGWSPEMSPGARVAHVRKLTQLLDVDDLFQHVDVYQRNGKPSYFARVRFLDAWSKDRLAELLKDFRPPRWTTDDRQKEEHARIKKERDDAMWPWYQVRATGEWRNDKKIYCEDEMTAVELCMRICLPQPWRH
jgi:Pyruvate/2-oxoacid:ferredoxin oxidoreductase delta subunit